VFDRITAGSDETPKIDTPSLNDQPAAAPAREHSDQNPGVETWYPWQRKLVDNWYPLSEKIEYSANEASREQNGRDECGHSNDDRDEPGETIQSGNEHLETRGESGCTIPLSISFVQLSVCMP
jgi:hypothetical protein